MKLKVYLSAGIFFLLIQIATAQTPIKVLFDARKAQMAGNADWVVDADLFNIGTGTGGIMQTGKGNEANPARYPTPAQSGITSSTSETYWKGALSSWGVALAKLGYTIETLPYNGSITYGSTTNPQDLSHYKVYIVDEPNIRYTAAEKTAILNFVSNGGGLFMIADHDVSDRNNDSWDSPHIWNDLMNSNGTVTNPFGITFDYANFSQTTSNFKVAATDPVLHGSAGNPTQMKFSNGTSMTLNTTANSSVVGIVYKTGVSTTGTTGVMMAHAHYGSGKVAAIGDSSPCDDGTGDTNDALYNGWSAEVNGDHARIFMNATIWLSNNVYRFGQESVSQGGLMAFPNPFSDQVNVSFNATAAGSYTVTVSDMTGKTVFNNAGECTEGNNLVLLPLENLSKGLYILQVRTAEAVMTQRIVHP